MEIESLKCLAGFTEDFGLNHATRSGSAYELSAVHCSEDSPTEVHDSGGGVSVQEDVSFGRQEALESIAEADKLKSQLFRGSAGSTQHGIEPGAVAAAGKDADALHSSILKNLALYRRPPFGRPSIIESPTSLYESGAIFEAIF